MAMLRGQFAKSCEFLMHFYVARAFVVYEFFMLMFSVLINTYRERGGGRVHNFARLFKCSTRELMWLTVSPLLCSPFLFFFSIMSPLNLITLNCAMNCKFFE